MQKFLQKYFIPILFAICTFGFLLRFYQYDKYPKFLETADEVMYPWGGISFLKSGKPTSWSFSHYKDSYVAVYWNNYFPMVSPWIEKPPLYSLITGLVAIAAQQDEFDEIKISTIRLVPIFLSVFSVFLVGLLAKKFFNLNIALLAAFLYATIPTIVIANRLSVTENLLTPIILATLWLFTRRNSGKIKQAVPYLVGIGCGLAILTRQTGIVLPATILGILFYKKNLREFLIVAFITFIFGLIQPIIGFYYDWRLFLQVLKDYKNLFANGLPGSVESIFRYPMITHIDIPFADGSILAGYILLLSSPLWIKIKNSFTFLIIPFLILMLILIIQHERAIFGWHLYPIFPFLAILLSVVFFKFWQKSDFLTGAFLFLIIGSSSFRFFSIIYPVILQAWQKILFLLLVIFLGSLLFKNLSYKRAVLIIFFVIFTIVNILSVINFGAIYQK